MFNDDEPLYFKKMHEFSTGDGFVEMANSLADMIRFVGNEPSVGLFYIQQHAHNAVPNLINLKTKVASRCRETSLRAQDSEDSTVMVRSMKHCGFRIAKEMIKDIRHCLAVISFSTRQEEEKRKKGLSIKTGSSSFRVRKTDPFSGPQLEFFRSSGYLSDVFRSPRSMKWPKREESGEELKMVKVGNDDEADNDDDLPVSTQVVDELAVDISVPCHNQIHSHLNDSYDELNIQARFEDWLEGRGNQ
ncbi:unnamed protein product [Cuscuta europaea]|uniref:Uncharacterized protein n=2 Tax=Cuscuta europaea TaxID=41803 RepID=A0A9P0ZXI1_CUSEU|nr:unnamed protein product [Cuscuta europaea]